MRDLLRPGTTTVAHPFGRGPGSRTQLGIDGAGLARLAELGLPTPPGFTISTAAWRAYAAGGSVPAAIRAEVLTRLADLAAGTDGVRGASALPPLVMVRCTAPSRVPGLLGPVVDLGIGEATIAAVGAAAGRPFAARRWRAFLRGFGTEVRGLPAAELEAELRVHDDPLGGARALRELIATRSGLPVPDDLEGQLEETLVAAWESWSRPAAVAHRRRARLPDDLGVAVVVQAMVHGDLDRDSGVGSATSRNPATGSPSASGSFRPFAAGDARDARLPLAALRSRLPAASAELDAALPLIEASYRDVCAVDFAVQSGRLWVLRAEPGARSDAATVRIATDLVDAGLITAPEALARIPLSVMRRLQAATSTPDRRLDVLDLCVSRVLQWADEWRRVQLRPTAPVDAPVVRGPEDVPAIVDGPVVVAPPADHGCDGSLQQTVAALVDAGARSLVLRVAEGPGLDRLRPPAGPWSAVVADPRSWAARLLAGRIEVLGRD